jgi:hypothetical protein
VDPTVSSFADDAQSSGWVRRSQSQRRLLVLGCRQLRSVLAEYLDQYDRYRPHRALGADSAARAWRISCRRAGWEGSRGEIGSVG